MKAFQRFAFEVKFVLALVTWLCLATGCLEFGAKENMMDTTGMLSSDEGYMTGQFIPDHDPPVSGQNSLEFVLADEDGNPIEGAEVTATPFMPSMGHGSTEVPIVKELEDGEYLATNIVYTMKGEWTLTIEVKTDSTEDSFVLLYDVE